MTFTGLVPRLACGQPLRDHVSVLCERSGITRVYGISDISSSLHALVVSLVNYANRHIAGRRTAILWKNSHFVEDRSHAEEKVAGTSAPSSAELFSSTSSMPSAVRIRGHIPAKPTTAHYAASFESSETPPARRRAALRRGRRQRHLDHQRMERDDSALRSGARGAQGLPPMRFISSPREMPCRVPNSMTCSSEA